MEGNKFRPLALGAAAAACAFLLGRQWGVMETEKQLLTGGVPAAVQAGSGAGMGEAAGPASDGASQEARRAAEGKLKGVEERLIANPDDSGALAEKGALLYELQRCEEAVEVLEKATASDPKNSGAWNDLALCYHQVEREEDAMKAVDKAIEAAPDFQHAYLSKGFFLARSGDLKGAKEIWQKAKEIDPDSDAGQAAEQMMSSHAKVGDDSK